MKASTIAAAVEVSLNRLQTDHIDVYFAHIDDQKAPLIETLDVFARLIREGKVRTIGASNYTAERLSEALTVSASKELPRYEVLQPRYNLYDRKDFESGLEKVAYDNDLGVISYFALASGFLAGKYRCDKDLEGKTRAGFVKGYLNERGQKILRARDDVSAHLSISQAQVALAWLIARPGITAPIVSATSISNWTIRSAQRVPVVRRMPLQSLTQPARTEARGATTRAPQRPI